MRKRFQIYLVIYLKTREESELGDQKVRFLELCTWEEEWREEEEEESPTIIAISDPWAAESCIIIEPI